MENKKWIIKIRKILKQNPKVFKKSCLVLLALGVAITMNHALALPAITTEGTLICSQEEHTHNEDCYKTETRLICTNEDEAHVHDESCYQSEQTLTCTKQEHTHNENCYKKAAEKNEVSVQDESGVTEEGLPGENESEKPVQLKEDDINKVSLQVSSDGNYWWDLDIKNPNAEIKDNDKLKFFLSYQIPAGTLKSDGVIEYQLPKTINKVNKKENGEIKDGNDVVGHYSIDENGKVTFHFNENMVEKNQKLPINGTFSFESSANEIVKNENGQYDLPFNKDFNLTINGEKKKGNAEDLTIKKENSGYNRDTNEITYTITITSKNGTSEAVKLEDVMENVKFDRIESIILNGEDKTTAYSFSDYKDKDKFSLELPIMKENATYVVKYVAKVNLSNGGQVVYTKNNVTVKSEDKDNKELENRDDASLEVSFKYLEKKVEEQNDKFLWTIIVNPNKQDIGGMTLNDFINGTQLKEKVKISPPISIDGKQESEVFLPIKFPKDTKETYTITYTTDKIPDMNSNETKNKAVLKTEDGKEKDSAESNKYSGADWYNPISKKGTNITADKDGKVIIDWESTINAEKYDINFVGDSDNWFIEDTLHDGQYFTEAQFNALKSAIEEAMPGAEVTAKYRDQNNKEIMGFKAVFKTPLTKGKKITFKYQSTAKLEDFTSERTYHNQIKINDKAEVYVDMTYKPSIPTIEKSDAYNNVENKYDSSHNHRDLEDGILSWYLKLNIPKNYNGGELTITETLPEGVTLTDLKLIGKESEGDIDLHPDRFTQDESFKVNQNYNIITIKISENYLKNCSAEYLKFLVKAKIKSEFSWNTDANDSSKPIGIFNNKVEIYDKNGEKIDGDEQKQTIEKNENDGVIQKSGLEKDNIAAYQLIINPENADLLEGASTLTLIDELTYGHQPDDTFDMSLIPESVLVYKYDASKEDFKGEQLESSSCPYTYHAESKQGNGEIEEKRKLTITIPNKMGLVIEYKYQCSTDRQKDNWEGRYVKNTAKISGLTISDNKNHISTPITVETHEATAHVSGLTVVKVNKDNYAMTLEGAKFKLEEYDPKAQKYVETDTTNNDLFTTDVDGEINIPLAISSKPGHLKYNVAYKLTETTAPEHYNLEEEPYFFYFYDPDLGDVKKPSNFNGEIIRKESKIHYFENESNVTEISVIKNWIDSENNKVENPNRKSISFELLQCLETERAEVVFHEIPSAGSISPDSIFYKDLSYSYPVGSTVDFILNLYPKYNDGANHALKINGKNIELDWQKSENNDPFIYTDKNGDEKTADRKASVKIPVQVSKNNLVSIETNTYDVYCELIEPSIEEEAKVISRDTYSILAENNWELSISNLPKKITQEVDGKMVTYNCTYRVKELTEGNVTYENNGGILTGMIQINNPIDTSLPPEIELPESGEKAQNGKLYIDLALSTIALLYLLILFRNEKGTV